MKPDLKGLLKLGRALKRVPRNQFDMTRWWEEVTDKNDKGSCGTAGCIAGWAATVFPHRFKRVEIDTIQDDNGRMLKTYDVVHRSTGASGTDAFAAGFRISDEEAYKITDGGARHSTPKTAARAIFRLVARLKRQS